MVITKSSPTRCISAGSTLWRQIRDEHDEWQTGKVEKGKKEKEVERREDIDIDLKDKIVKGLLKIIDN